MLIRNFPAGGAPGPADTRKTKVKGFPFTVVYRDDASEIVIGALQTRHAVNHREAKRY